MRKLFPFMALMGLAACGNYSHQTKVPFVNSMVREVKLPLVMQKEALSHDTKKTLYQMIESLKHHKGVLVELIFPIEIDQNSRASALSYIKEILNTHGLISPLKLTFKKDQSPPSIKISYYEVSVPRCSGKIIRYKTLGCVSEENLSQQIAFPKHIISSPPLDEAPGEKLARAINLLIQGEQVPLKIEEINAK